MSLRTDIADLRREVDDMRERMGEALNGDAKSVAECSRRLNELHLKVGALEESGDTLAKRLRHVDMVAMGAAESVSRVGVEVARMQSALADHARSSAEAFGQLRDSLARSSSEALEREKHRNQRLALYTGVVVALVPVLSKVVDAVARWWGVQ